VDNVFGTLAEISPTRESLLLVDGAIVTGAKKK
jgi:hypothetical protein